MSSSQTIYQEEVPPSASARAADSVVSAENAGMGGRRVTMSMVLVFKPMGASQGANNHFGVSARGTETENHISK